MKYIICSTITISVHTEVEATSMDAALRKAADRPMQTLCDQCSRGEESDREWVTSGELDGHPLDSELTEVFAGAGERLLSTKELAKANRIWRGGK